MFTKSIHKTIFFAALLTLFLGFSMQSNAQSQASGAPEITSEDRQAFEKANQAIATLAQKQRAELGDVESQQEAQMIQQKYHQKMVNKIQKEGLSVEKFNAIAAQSTQ